MRLEKNILSYLLLSSLTLVGCGEQKEEGQAITEGPYIETGAEESAALIAKPGAPLANNKLDDIDLSQVSLPYDIGIDDMWIEKITSFHSEINGKKVHYLVASGGNLYQPVLRVQKFLRDEDNWNLVADTGYFYSGSRHFQPNPEQFLFNADGRLAWFLTSGWAGQGVTHVWVHVLADMGNKLEFAGKIRKADVDAMCFEDPDEGDEDSLMYQSSPCYQAKSLISVVEVGGGYSYLSQDVSLKIRDRNKNTTSSSKDNYAILFDEKTESYRSPDWQKEIIKCGVEFECNGR